MWKICIYSYQYLLLCDSLGALAGRMREDWKGQRVSFSITSSRSMSWYTLCLVSMLVVRRLNGLHTVFSRRAFCCDDSRIAFRWITSKSGMPLFVLGWKFGLFME